MGIMDQNPAYKQTAFALYAPTPPPLVQFEDAINASAPAIPTGTPYPGKIDHWAATTRGYIHWGVPTNGSDVQFADLAGWGLDLNSVWQDYEIARLAGYSAGVGTYFATYVGGTTGRFTMDQLIADVDAFNLVALYPPQTTLEVSLGVYLQRCYNDPKYRWRQFIINRCGNSLATAAQMAVTVFSTTDQSIQDAVAWKDQAFDNASSRGIKKSCYGPPVERATHGG